MSEFGGLWKHEETQHAPKCSRTFVMIEVGCLKVKVEEESGCSAKERGVPCNKPAHRMLLTNWLTFAVVHVSTRTCTLSNAHKQVVQFPKHTEESTAKA